MRVLAARRRPARDRRRRLPDLRLATPSRSSGGMDVCRGDDDRSDRTDRDGGRAHQRRARRAVPPHGERRARVVVDGRRGRAVERRDRRRRVTSDAARRDERARLVVRWHAAARVVPRQSAPRARPARAVDGLRVRAAPVGAAQVVPRQVGGVECDELRPERGAGGARRARGVDARSAQARRQRRSAGFAANLVSQGDRHADGGAVAAFFGGNLGVVAFWARRHDGAPPRSRRHGLDGRRRAAPRHRPSRRLGRAARGRRGAADAVARYLRPRGRAVRATHGVGGREDQVHRAAHARAQDVLQRRHLRRRARRHADRRGPGALAAYDDEEHHHQRGAPA
mmetsp:Transcript_22597/g.89717  ORF Transcript_22597/g.89717 Transcript_22597/m.89717 type:complete len:339 (-) Transcript_22597:382-1398(-)